MTAYIKVASLRRGIIDPPEPCSEEENRALNHARDHEIAFVIGARQAHYVTFDDWLAEARPFRNSERYIKTRCA